MDKFDKSNDDLFGFDNKPNDGNNDKQQEPKDIDKPSFSSDERQLPINSNPPVANGMSLKKRILIIAMSVLAIAFIFISGIFVAPLFTSKEIRAFEWALDQIEKNYIGDIVDGKNAYTREDFVKYGFALLDPYSRLMTPQEFEVFNESMEGSEQGVGISIAIKEHDSKEYASVEGVIKGSLAYNKIFAGDLLIKINGSTLEIVNGGLRGYKLNGIGKDEVFDVLRPVFDEESNTVNYVEINGIVVKNSKYDASYVTYYDSKSEMQNNILPSNTAYLKLDMFNKPADSEFSVCMNKMKNDNINNLIFDLRGNPGGLLDISKYIASYLITDGNSSNARFLSMEYKGNKKIHENVTDIKYNSMNFDKIVVLVDNDSASASEVLLAAMIDYGTVDLIIGSKTYGKGIAQSTIRHNTGYALTLTVSRWLSPNGTSYHKSGILPSAGYETEKSTTNYPYMLNRDTDILKALEYINA